MAEIYCCENCGWSEIVGSPIMCHYTGERTWHDECCEAWKPKNAEVIDAVQVTRCKNCKHRPTQTEPGKEGCALDFPDAMCPCRCIDEYYSWYPEDDWFCANGECAES